MAEPGRAVVEELAPFLTGSLTAGQWAGATTANRERVAYYRSVPAAVGVLTGRSVSLWDWVGPLMPTELHFLRHDGSVVLGTVPCDAYAWLEVDDDELAAITAALPPGVRLGVFDPIDEMDAWLSVYGGDLEWHGELMISWNHTGEQVWRSVSVSSPKLTATLRLDGHARLSITYQYGSRNHEEESVVSASSQLQRLLTCFYEEVERNSLLLEEQ